MGDIGPEQIQNQPEVVKLNQRFALFDPRRTQSLPKTDQGFNRYKSSIIFDSNETLPRFKINIIADRADLDALRVTPFDSEAGYTITEEDLELGTRIAKKKRLRSEDLELEDGDEKKRDLVNSTRAPLDLVIAEDNLLKSSLIYEARKDKLGKPYYKLKPEALDILKRLRIQVFFPKSRWEGQPGKYSLDSGFLVFVDYYPIDTGSLPVEKPHPQSSGVYNEGLDIGLPDDPEKLQQIYGRFILLNKEKTDELKDEGGDI